MDIKVIWVAMNAMSYALCEIAGFEAEEAHQYVEEHIEDFMEELEYMAECETKNVPYGTEL